MDGGRWQRVRTQSGWHLRFVAGNGERVVTGEVVDDKESVDTALASLLRSTLAQGGYQFSAAVKDPALQMAAELLEDVDER